MKVLALHIVFILLVSVSNSTLAQTTAIMKVSVTVVSGNNAHSTEPLVISGNSELSKSGELVIKTAPFMDVEIFASTESWLSNKTGDEILLKTDTLTKSDISSGTHLIKTDGILSSSAMSSGLYKGISKATIEYL